ncbi:MAG TPA: thiamine-phosphate kinase [Rhizomicrobium sp.]|jgi:thiamine-monophosphate kinase
MSGRTAEPPRRPGEFELIEKLFAPMAHGAAGAFGLRDDAAVLAPPDGHEFVLKVDSVIEGVHFRRSDPAQTVGRKALRRALSDLAAKGAEPQAWLLALALPTWPDMEWLEAFAAGLSADREEFGIPLVGGETNATPGPLTITITAIGNLPADTLIRRNGAKPRDGVFVTGTIGDAGAGLSLASAQKPPEAARDFLVSRYRVPLPRLAFGRALRGFASAAIDVSDGLLADLGHIAGESGVRIAVEADRIPLSDALRQIEGEGVEARVRAATAGDDYEITFTAPGHASLAIEDAARRTGTVITRIGRVMAGDGLALLSEAGAEIPVDRTGYTHF